MQRLVGRKAVPPAPESTSVTMHVCLGCVCVCLSEKENEKQRQRKLVSVSPSPDDMRPQLSIFHDPG